MTLFDQSPRLGLVIGTHGTPAYIHLHLENAKQLYPDVPVLVYDDCSDKILELNQLCVDYGADFDFNHQRLGHYLGDIFIFAKSLLWAKRQGVELLVKMSRRWLPLRDWREELTALAMEGQYPSYSSYCAYCRFMFRTECVAIHVDSWLTVWNEIYSTAIAGEDIGLPEAYMHGLAKKVCQKPGSYVMWPLLGESRFTHYPDVLWHSSCAISDYTARAKELGLPYEDRDFEDIK